MAVMKCWSEMYCEHWSKHCLSVDFLCLMRKTENFQIGYYMYTLDFRFLQMIPQNWKYSLDRTWCITWSWTFRLSCKHATSGAVGSERLNMPFSSRLFRDEVPMRNDVWRPGAQSRRSGARDRAKRHFGARHLLMQWRWQYGSLRAIRGSFLLCARLIKSHCI